MVSHQIFTAGVDFNCDIRSPSSGVFTPNTWTQPLRI